MLPRYIIFLFEFILIFQGPRATDWFSLVGFDVLFEWQCNLGKSYCDWKVDLEVVLDPELRIMFGCVEC